MRAFHDKTEPSANRDRLAAWRVQRLRAAGCSAQLAQAVARDGRYDLHELLELIDRGCSAALAARILAPLEDGEQSR
jgi:hypothetical protein